MASLDAILADVSTLHKTARNAPKRKMQDHSLEVYSPFLLARQPQTAAPQNTTTHQSQVELCRNLECSGRNMTPAFEVDSRHGDRICTHCGAVQNVRSIENLEEEHRTFNDDDGKSKSRKRAEVQRDGRSSTNVGDQNLARAAQIAGATAESGDAFSDAERKRLDQIQGKINMLSSHMQLSGATVDKARHLAEQIVLSQIEHDKRCSLSCQESVDNVDKPKQKCRLSKRPKHKTIIAAALINVAKREDMHDIQFQELAEACRVDISCQSVKDSEVRAVYVLVCDWLKFGEVPREIDGGRGKYPCAADPAYRLEGGITTDKISGGEAEDTAKSLMTQHYAILPRLRQLLNLPYLVERRASMALDYWMERGIRAVKPQTAAACAIHYAFEMSKERVKRASGGETKELSIESLSDAAGIEAGTILKVAQELGEPNIDDPDDLVLD